MLTNTAHRNQFNSLNVDKSSLLFKLRSESGIHQSGFTKIYIEKKDKKVLSLKAGDPDPHYFKKLGPDQHNSQRLDPDPL
jgi:hypothetical protein